jgi:dihydroxyacetone kinase-like protein
MTMKKLINHPEQLLTESLRGFSKAHADIIAYDCHEKIITRLVPNQQPKVAIISGGGTGHEPLHAGFVGFGMLDAACPGEIFTSPTPFQMEAAVNAVENGAGVLFIVKNYAGDVMNFEIAAEMLSCENASVLVTDDASLPKDHSAGRRGVAGTLIIEKIVGAAAEQGANLATCQALGEKVNQCTASMGVALSSCTLPALGKPTFELAENEIEMGVGIHGEHGCETQPLTDANTIVNQLISTIYKDLALSADQNVLLHVNGFGATPSIELYLVYEIAAQFLETHKINVIRSLVGNYTTSLDMAGCSITLTCLDDELTQLWDAPVHTANLRWGIE